MRLLMPEKISLNVHYSFMFKVVCIAVSINKVFRFSMNSEK